MLRNSSLSSDMPSNSKVNSKRKGFKNPFKLFGRKQDSPQSTDPDSTHGQSNTRLSPATTPIDPTDSSPPIPPIADGSSIPRETEAPSTQGVTEDAVISNISLALDVGEKLAKFFQTVPFVAPAAGLLSQGLKVYQEVKDTNDKRDGLLARVTGINQDLYATILRMEATNHVDLLTRLKPDVETYAGLIKRASEHICKYNSHGTVSRVVGRKQLQAKLDGLQREFDLFGDRFKTNRLVDLAIQQGVMRGALDKVHDMVVIDKLKQWLGPLPNMKEKQHETQKLRKEGTGNWLLDDKKFIEWREYPRSLWIQGNSGTGKSVLSSTVIDELFRDQQFFNDLGKPSAVAFFYFDFKDKAGHAVERALRHIIWQLSASSPHQYRALEEQHKVSNGATLPTYQDLQHILEVLLREIGRTYLVLDALDECSEELGQLMDLILRLREWDESPLHLLFTSQPWTEFIDGFKDVTSICLDSSVTEGDIKLFVDKELRENRKMKTWAPHTDEISKRVVSQSGGMFRLAACFLFELSRCVWTDELDEALGNLPNDLFGIYDRFLQPVIGSKYFPYVAAVLQWLMYSQQPLTLAKVADAIAFDFSDPAHHIYKPSRRNDNAKKILEWLEGLVTITVNQDFWTSWEPEQKLSLAHSSVKDYILSPHFTTKFGYDLSAGPAHTFIAQSCICYLLHFANHPLNSSTFPSYPLAQYAAQNWCYHLLQCQDQTVLLADAMCLLENGTGQYIALNNLRNPGYGNPNWTSSIPPPLCLCSEEGYTQGLQALLTRGADVNAQSERGCALQIASQSGHTEIVGHLLEYNNIQDKEGALELASERGHMEIVCLLIAKGADVNGKDGEPLYAASKGSWLSKIRGQTDIVRLLLENGADINLHNKERGTALYAAAKNGYIKIVHLLLEKGADVNFHKEGRGTVLHAAVESGHVEVVHLLLQKGAEVNAQDGFALYAASREGNSQLVHLLLENSADVNVYPKTHGSALHAASQGKKPASHGKKPKDIDNLNEFSLKSGHIDIVHLLLEKGADINAHDERHETALHAASSLGHIEIVRVLLDRHVDVNVHDKIHGTALCAASREGHLEIVCLLLDRGADVNVHDEKHGTVLCVASRERHLEMVCLLLDRGADVNVDDGKNGTALCIASQEGHLEIVHILLGRGADINVKNGAALRAASSLGHLEIVHLLLDRGANVNAHDEKHGTALCAASNRGQLEIVHVLLDRGADVNAQGELLGTALHCASCTGDTKLVDLLLKNGADPNVHGQNHGTALHEALFWGHTDVGHLLLENGADPSAYCGNSASILQYAAWKGKTEIVGRLLANGADVNASGGEYYPAHLQVTYCKDLSELVHGSALEAACSWGHLDTASLLVERGADVNACSGSALQAAAALPYGQRPDNLVHFLLQNGANINTHGGRRGSALHAASWVGNTKIVGLLLDNGAEVNAQVANYGSALWSASLGGHVETACFLLAKGAHVNTHPSALTAAALSGHIPTVRLLLENGADVNSHDEDIGSALQAASWQGYNEQRGKYGSPLQAASGEGYFDIIDLLRENGAVYMA